MSTRYPVPFPLGKVAGLPGTWNTPLTTASADVTVALTGQAITSAQGSIVEAISYGLTGQAITAAQGSIVEAISYGLSGQAITSTAGTVVPAVSYGLTGQAATFAQGNVSTGNDVTLSLTGQSVAFSTGTLSGAVAYALTGSAATAQQGSAVAIVSYAASGQAGTFSAGSVSPDISQALTGQAVAAQQGNVGVPGDVTIALTGQAASFSQGDLSASVEAPSSGGGGGRVGKKRKLALYINGQRMLGTQEDFERLVAQSFKTVPEKDLPAISVRVEDKRDSFKEAAQKLEAELEHALRVVHKRAYEAAEEEEILEFL